MASVITVDGERFNADYLKGIDDRMAVRQLEHIYSYSTIMKAWKIANGKSVPNVKKSSASEKKKPIDEQPIEE